MAKEGGGRAPSLLKTSKARHGRSDGPDAQGSSMGLLEIETEPPTLSLKDWGLYLAWTWGMFESKRFSLQGQRRKASHPPAVHSTSLHHHIISQHAYTIMHMAANQKRTI